MHWRNVLTIVLAIVLAATVGYSLYLRLGPYNRLSRENQRLMAELETRQASKSEAEGQVSQLRKTLEGQRREIEEATNELAKRDNLIKDLMTRKEVLRVILSRVQGQKETLEMEATQLRRDLAKSESHLRELSQEMEKLKGESQGEIQGLKDQLSQRGGQIQGFQDQADQLRGEMAILQGERKALSDQISVLEDALEQSRDRIQTLSQALAQKEERLKQAGQNYQALVSQLKEQIQQKEVQISTLEEKLSIHFLDRILFEPGNANITPHGRKILRKVAEGLKKLPDTEIRVEGHTDNQPLSEAARAVYVDNLDLSVERAAAVARTLRAMGVGPRNISVSGYSMYRPVSGNDTPEGRQLNRRVEIVLVPLR